MKKTVNANKCNSLILKKARLILKKIRDEKEKATPPFYLPVSNFDIYLNMHSLKYLIFKGGRGSGKSFKITCFLIEQSFNECNNDSLFIFAREIQTSISESVYALAKSMIQQAHLSTFFIIQSQKIINILTGVQFVFIGLRSTAGKTAFSQVNKIKGKFDIKYIFVDEAQDLSEDTINVLFPTVNRSAKVGIIEKTWHDQVEIEDLTKSRLLFAMNPNFDSDPIVLKIQKIIDYEKSKFQRATAEIIHINIFDLPIEIQDQQLLQQAKAEEKEIYYNHVWLGEASHKISGYPWAQLEEVYTNEKIDCYCAFLDPSFKGGDFTAIAFLGKLGNDLCLWGYCFKLAWNRATDEIIGLLEQHKPESFYYEDNSLGTVVQDVYAENNINAIAHTTLGNKEARIYKVAGFLAHRAKLIHNLCNTAFINNVLKYNENEKFDDGADALASVILKSGLISNKIKF